jgi:thiol-disulfide isomerase/thioredoxin
MRRRAVLAGSAAAVAGAAGIAVGFRRTHRAGGDDAAAPVADVWTLTFETPDGAPLPMSRLRGRPLLLNFWATWCAPCATEMPLLDGFAASPAAAGWNVLALAVDSVDPVRRFIRERKLHLPIALAGAVGLDLSRSLGNSVGALPYTVAFDAAGHPHDRRLGVLDAALLARWARPSE